MPVTPRVSAEYLSQSVQELVAAAGIIAYLAHTMTAVRIGRWPLLAAGAVLFTATFIIGRRLGTQNRSAREPIAVAFVAWLGFAMPVAALPGPRGPGFISSAIGIATVYILWAALRYEIQPRQSDGLLRNLGWGLGWGAALAAGFSLIAIVIIAINGRTRPGGEALPFILGGYWIGGIVGGAVAGLLRPMTGWPLARMGIGVLVGFCAYGAIALALGAPGDPEVGDMTLREQAVVALMCAFAVGPPAALGTIDW